jgi:hypothetical protein
MTNSIRGPQCVLSSHAGAARSKQTLNPSLPLLDSHWMAPVAALTVMPSKPSPVPEYCVPSTVNLSLDVPMSNAST